MLAGERSEELLTRVPFYIRKIALSEISGAVRRSSQYGCCGAGISVSETLLGDDRETSGARIYLAAAKDIFGAPRRGALNAGRPSSWCSLGTMQLWGASLH